MEIFKIHLRRCVPQSKLWPPIVHVLPMDKGLLSPRFPPSRISLQLGQNMLGYTSVAALISCFRIIQFYFSVILYVYYGFTKCCCLHSESLQDPWAWREERAHRQLFKASIGVPVMAQRVKNLTTIYKDVGSIPCLTQWVKGSGIAMSCLGGHRCNSDLALLWLWHRPAAAAPI